MKCSQIEKGMKVLIKVGGGGTAIGVVEETCVSSEGNRYKHRVSHGPTTYPNPRHFYPATTQSGYEDVWSQHIICEVDKNNKPLYSTEQQAKLDMQMTKAVAAELSKIDREEQAAKLVFHLNALGVKAHLSHLFYGGGITIETTESKMDMLADLVKTEFDKQSKPMFEGVE